MANQNTRRLMERLASDDAFRAQVEQDPVAAFKAHGITIDPKQVPAGGVKLPSKETLKTSLDQHVNTLDAAMSGIVIFKA